MELMGFIGDIETFNGLGDAREWFHDMNTSNATLTLLTLYWKENSTRNGRLHKLYASFR